MTLNLLQPDQVAKEIVAFIKQVFIQAQKKIGIVGVSGGIDSALALTLLTRALGEARIKPVLLPYGNQDVDDGWLIIDHLKIPHEQVESIDIQPIVDQIAQTLKVDDQMRLGNLKARVRMICLFDLAKKHEGLVCGTENKSESLLGYFTRFGDSASDLEPIAHLYKTQVRELARFLNLPTKFLTKPPSAGLWDGQTDEAEFGFSYAEADEVLENPDTNLEPEIKNKVLAQVEKMEFKHLVPYKI